MNIRHPMYAASTDGDLSDSDYRTWYQLQHIPDVLRTGSVDKGAFYHATQPGNLTKWPVTYHCYDIDLVEPKNS